MIFLQTFQMMVQGIDSGCGNDSGMPAIRSMISYWSFKYSSSVWLSSRSAIYRQAKCVVFAEPTGIVPADVLVAVRQVELRSNSRIEPLALLELRAGLRELAFGRQLATLLEHGARGHRVLRSDVSPSGGRCASMALPRR